MHRAKALGKRGYELFDPAMRDQALSRMHLELDLRKVIEHGHYRCITNPSSP